MVLEPGAVVCVLATDPQAPGDFIEFCEASGHALLESLAADGLYKILVRRRG